MPAVGDFLAILVEMEELAVEGGRGEVPSISCGWKRGQCGESAGLAEPES
jgi:hypothetical protein